MNLQSIAGIFFTGVGFSIVVFLIYAIRKARDVQGWLDGSGTITSLSVDEEWAKAGSSRFLVEVPHVTYTYTVEGCVFTGDKLSIAEIDSASRADAMKKADGLAVGKEVTVYYNPSNPREAYLSKKVDSTPLVVIGFGAVAFVTMGMLLLFKVI